MALGVRADIAFGGLSGTRFDNGFGYSDITLMGELEIRRVGFHDCYRMT
ncbi:MAG: hypothetical protein ACYSSL_02040 [Planctomycetota bacterium]